MAKSVCIVGAGPSGLVAAKSLLHDAAPGRFRACLFDARDGIGGLWPASVTELERPIDPLMVANQSKHTMQFSDLAWEEDVPQHPRAWMVGRYLERYQERYLAGRSDLQIRLATRVLGARRREPEAGGGWEVRVRCPGGSEEKLGFDYLLVASGFFGEAIIPDILSASAAASVPVFHSSRYRHLGQLFGDGSRPARGKILVVGSQLSGFETAALIATQLSSATNSPGGGGQSGSENYTVHHLLDRPVWVLPRFVTPEPNLAAPAFVPLDMWLYNDKGRSRPLVNTQGHFDADEARKVHNKFETMLGTDQSVFSPLLTMDETAKQQQPPYLAISDYYCDFVRAGSIKLSSGRLESMCGSTAILSSGQGRVEEVVAVIAATGFDPSPSIGFLDRETLKKLHHSGRDVVQPLALAFHGTHHREVPGLGFVGFYRSPFWGVMQMQARFLAELWSGAEAMPGRLVQKLAADESVQRTLSLRGDAKLSQFPMGDYLWLMQEFAEALSMERRVVRGDFPDKGGPLEMVTPAQYRSGAEDGLPLQESNKSVSDSARVAEKSLRGQRLVARAVFRSLLGSWKLERQVESRVRTHSSGHFSGTARFLLRDQTAGGGAETGLEYLYVEDGEFRTEQGFGFRATRRYVWRYDEAGDRLSVWFVRTDDEAKTADGLFHELDFQSGRGGEAEGWRARAGHVCAEDKYETDYEFVFASVNLGEWRVNYGVKGPRKDYSIRGVYRR